jgi:L-fucose isomerase-like protein
MKHRFDVVTMHPSALLDGAEPGAVTGGYLAAIRELGGNPRPASAAAEKLVPVFLLVATGGSEKAILDWWAEHGGDIPDGRLRLIAHPGNNSLPAALEVLARLQQDGTPGRIFYLRGVDDGFGLRQIADAVHDHEVRSTLERARIGVVGAPSDWLVASVPDAATVKKTWGPTLVSVELDEVVNGHQAASDADVEALADDLAAGASEVHEPTPSDRLDVARIYVALQRLIAAHQLDALTVRCFDLVLNQKTTGCFALSQLLDDGVVAGCEGDVVSTTGMLWARELLGSTPWMANPAQLDPENNTLWLAHCTVPRSLVSSYGLRSHFESGLGVGIQGVLAAGPVTLLRIGGRQMDRVWLAEGEILGSGKADNLCRTQAEIRLTGGGRVADLLRAPLGNHLVLSFGHHLERLQSWCADSSLRFTE